MSPLLRPETQLAVDGSLFCVIFLPLKFVFERDVTRETDRYYLPQGQWFFLFFKCSLKAIKKSLIYKPR